MCKDTHTHTHSREKLISEYVTQPEPCLTYDDSNKISYMQPSLYAANSKSNVCHR